MKQGDVLPAQQSEILVILYKFRFATINLITTYLNLNTKTYTHHALTKLTKQGYISRKYTGKDKITGKPAIYYLNNLGIKYLSNNPDLDKKILNLIYKDKYASDSFIKDSLKVFQIYIAYRTKYRDKMDFYTKSETHEYPYFIKPNPHAYISFDNSEKADQFLELITIKTPYFAIKRRINQYIKHYQSELWQNQIGMVYPELILRVDDNNLANRLSKAVSSTLDNISITELNIKVIYLNALFNNSAFGICQNA